MRPAFSKRSLQWLLGLTMFSSSVAAAALPQNGQAITGGCPSGGSTYTSVNGIIYLICPNSDYHVDNIADYAVPDAPSCAEICSHTLNCVNVVYEPGWCHLKGAPTQPNWIQSNYYTTITAVYTPISGQNIVGGCPFNQTIFLSGNQVFSYCPYSNYPIDNANNVNVNSLQQCADTCAQTQGCQTVVYEPGVCHTKVAANNPPLQVDTYYSTFTLLYTLNNGQSTNGKCLGGQTYYNSAKGVNYRICPYSDHHIDNVQDLQAYDAQSCAALCDQAQSCTAAVYEPPTGWCHLKGAPSNPNTIQSNYYWTITAVPYQPVAGAEILETCPYNMTTYAASNGVQFQVCPQSSYGVSPMSSVSKPNLASCMEWCSTTAGCFLAQYNSNAQICYSMGYPLQPYWTESTSLTSFRVAPAAYNSPSVISLNGKWDAVVTLTLIPVAAYLVPAYPVVQQFLSFSSWSPYTFGGAAHYDTAFLSFNITSGQSSEFDVAQTQHDMFCPGMNALPDGRLVIDGGNTDAAVTIYDPFANTWTRAADMNIGRGYQSSVTTSDGRAFTIGGSFTGGYGGVNGVPLKNGEIYNPASNNWTALPGALVTPMLTTYDNAGVWRTDNHAWLHAWSGGSVFQAGPSKNMNWYNTTGQGNVTSAGQRNPQNDQMCGVSVMYDTGKIFNAGGSQSYSGDNALSVAHRVTLQGVNKLPKVEQLVSMRYPRIFAQAIVLPNGLIFITGGQQYGAGFSDYMGVLQSELFDPVANTTVPVAPLSIPRTYHSVGLLMPDGRIMNGGGGLCYVGGNCNNGNHPDLQFYSPPYLFDSNGNPAARPQVTSLKSSQQSGQKIMVSPGGTLTVTLSSVSNLSHVLVRMGSATHSVDTDQRRMPLTVKSTNGNTVTLSVPNDNGVVPPGFWYYFAVAPSGVHSIGQTVNVLVKS